MSSENTVNKAASSRADVSEPTAIRHSLAHYRALLLATLAVGLAGLVLLVVWVFNYRGGLGWSSHPELQFNWHVLTMTLAMVYVIAFEVMTFRVLRNGQKRKLKLIHASFFFFNILLLFIGYWSILDVHQGRPHFYSFHSWIAVLTSTLFIAQGALGFLSFLWPGIDLQRRVMYMPYHVFVGLTTFVLGVTTTLLGLFEVIKKIPRFTEEAVMMNICGILIVVFTALVVFLQTRPEYKRKPLPDD